MRWWEAERGISSIMIVILGMPLIVGVFGFGLDSARLALVHRQLQTVSDLAVFSAVNEASAVGSDGRYTLDDRRAIADVYLMYTSNTAILRGPSKSLNCSEASVQNGASGGACAGRARVFGTPLTQAQLCTAAGSGAKYGIRYSVNEKMNTTFMQIFGIDTWQIPQVNSDAVIRAKNC